MHVSTNKNNKKCKEDLKNDIDNTLRMLVDTVP